MEIVRFWEKLVHFKQPKCKSYVTFRKAGNNLVTNILKLFVELEVIEGCKTASDLLKIDLSMEKNLLKVNQISVAFATEKFLSDLMKKDLVDLKKVKSS